TTGNARFWPIASLVALLDRLPVCLCHHDAFRSNMLARDGVNDEAQTVAVDWSMIGYGGIGEELGNTTACGLRLDVAGEQAREMDQITFESYLDGLRDAGW
ncbi:MAG TPA: phosphotransferase, partial [Roseiflexaceae bacterium]|nr:phosphotransferase [Roseiflexaceae bacterium]